MESMHIETRPHGVSYLLLVLEPVRQAGRSELAGWLSCFGTVQRKNADISFGFALQQMK